ncbi:hypothetical protein Pmani_040254, partial [Petrolisthes manimaculis]
MTRWRRGSREVPCCKGGEGVDAAERKGNTGGLGIGYWEEKENEPIR